MRPPVLNPLFADITALSGVGPKLAALITKAAGARIVDLIFTPPISVIDRSNRPAVADAPPGQLVTLNVVVDRHDPPPKGRKLPYRVICSDDTGFLTLIFFRAREDYLTKILPPGERRLISGKIEDYKGARQMAHPDYIVDPDQPDALPLHEPVYPLTAGLTSNVMRKAVTNALARSPELSEWQDGPFLNQNKWANWHEALRALHSPTSIEDLSLNTPARQRLVYDELLANQLALGLIRRARKKGMGRAIAATGKLQSKARREFPYKLTKAQEAALTEITKDMRAPERMVRLLQGDVGSGKTIVAFLAMLGAVEAGEQAVIMAPTEILARQHLESLEPIARTIGVQIDLLTGRDKGASRQEKLKALEQGKIQLLIGTHAVFQKDVFFNKLAFVVIDEQHRFGVHQRIQLTQKGPKPDLLVMTATPIPRTLALTSYGDMDVSLIKEKPPGRKPISTRAVPLARINEIVSGIQRVIERGEQAYWVCPLVEESEILDLTAAEERFESLKAVFGDRVGMVHGQMKAQAKDAVMERFSAGEISVLIATTVIEVGVNVPSATIMIIEHAERFGLAQLHQLRGRVGRGDAPSSCVLLYKAPLGETAKARLDILRKSEDGFLIAEEDLRLRGAGDVIGAAQSGFPLFRLAQLPAHDELLAAANDYAKMIIASNPDLKKEKGAALRTLLYLFSRNDAVKLLDAG